MKYAKRTDANHKSIKKLFQTLGAIVKDTSKFGDGFPDLLIRWKNKIYFVEIKANEKSKLTLAEEKFQVDFYSYYKIVRSEKDVLNLLGVE